VDIVRYVVSQFIEKYWNSFLLFNKNAINSHIQPTLKFKIKSLKEPLDIWIVNRINSLAKEVKELLDDYLIFKAADAIQAFMINNLSNWYLRLVRKRFLEKDQEVYDLVYYVFDILNRLMAPFVPFLTERVFLEMQQNFGYSKDVKSVHLLNFPAFDEELIDATSLENMDFIINFIQDLRALREQVKIKIRQPIKEYLLTIDDKFKDIVKNFDSLIKNELNVKELNFISEKKVKSFYTEEIILNRGAIGRDFKKDRVKVEKSLESLNLDELKSQMNKGKLKVKIGENDYQITKEHLRIEQNAIESYGVKLFSYGTIIINTELSDELLKEGFSREFVRNIQNIRKKLNLSRFKEKIIINVKNDIDLENQLGSYIESVKSEIGCIKISRGKSGKPFSFKIQKEDIDLLIEVQE
ncbi:MAG: class I tRNA ligase family protein, partial [Candidatus Lokiarchaeota archaeon]|nr:class I tRNA ligase family protein [Candidatus Lokiarchaeota archaeon]